MNPALLDLIRPHYQTIQGYISAGMETEKDESNIFLNANENPYELTGLEGFNHYPEPQPQALIDGYAQLYNVPENNIILTRGADEALAVLTKIFCEPHQDSIIINPPTFGKYEVNAHAMPAEVIEVPLQKTYNGSYKLDEEKIISLAENPNNHVKIVFLCSPNNPTGTSFELESMIRICKMLEGYAVIVIDETYAEFASQSSMLPYLSELPNMIVLRTLSKSYSMAGIRMGTILSGDKDFVKLVQEKALDTYPLAHTTIDAALKVMTKAAQNEAKENIKKILSERTRLQKYLETSNIVNYIYPSDANFLLVEMDNAKEFVSYCSTRKIILRDFSDKPLTKNCIRISIGTPDQNDALMKLLQDFEQKTAA